MKIKKRNGKTVEMGAENAQPTVKESKGIPVSVAASFNALKKKEVSATTGANGLGPSANTGGMGVKTPTISTGENGQLTAKEPSDAYKERIKKRVK